MSRNDYAKAEALLNNKLVFDVETQRTEYVKMTTHFTSKLAILKAYSKDHHEKRDSLKEELLAALLNTGKSINHLEHVDKPFVENWLINHTLYWPLFIVLCLFLTAILAVQYKMRHTKRLQHFEAEIKHLNRQAERMQQHTSEQLGKGHQIYDGIINGGDMKNISIADEQCLVDYYAFAFPKEYATLTSPFTNLSLRHTTYLILSNMGFTDAQIKDILFVKGSTIRSYKLRINKKQK